MIFAESFDFNNVHHFEKKRRKKSEVKRREESTKTTTTKTTKNASLCKCNFESDRERIANIEIKARKKKKNKTNVVSTAENASG